MKTSSLRKKCIWICATGAFLGMAGLAACAPQVAVVEDQTASAVAQMPRMTPATDEYGVVVADSWKDIYPNEFATYEANVSNSPDSGKHDYLELYPALNAMYQGYAFALGYDEASGHLYTLDSVKGTPRTNEKEQLANCISCKTPQFTATVNTEGEEIYKKPFWDVVEQYDEPVSCYNCHENDPQSKIGRAHV